MCVAQQLWVVKVVGLPCGGPQAAASYTAAKGRIARIPQVVRYSNSSSSGVSRVPRGYSSIACASVDVRVEAGWV